MARNRNKEIRSSIGSANVGRTLSLAEAQRIATDTNRSVTQVRQVAQNQGYNIGGRLQNVLSPVTRGDTRRADVQLSAALQSGPVTQQTINQIARNTGRSQQQVSNAYMQLALGQGNQRGAVGGVGSLAEAEAIAQATGRSVPEVAQLMIDRGMSLGSRLVNNMSSGAGLEGTLQTAYQRNMLPDFLNTVLEPIQQQVRGLQLGSGQRLSGFYIEGGQPRALVTTRGGAGGRMAAGMGTQSTEPTTLSTGRRRSRGGESTEVTVPSLEGGLSMEDVTNQINSSLSGINMPDYADRFQQIQDQMTANMDRPGLQFASLGRAYSDTAARAARGQRRRRADYLRTSSLAPGFSSGGAGALRIGGVTI